MASLPLEPLRLKPGVDLRHSLEAHAKERGESGFVLAGIGSLSVGQIRMAGADEPSTLAGPLEVLSLSGAIGPDGVHLHLSVSDATGKVTGGHLAHGSQVLTTMELVIVRLMDWSLGREWDAATGYPELVVRKGSRGSM